MTLASRTLRQGRGAFLIIALAAAAAMVLMTAAQAQVTTLPRGDARRTAVLDALRPMVEAEVGAPVEFVVGELRVLGPWAFVLATPQRPGGGQIDYGLTRYRDAVVHGAFGGRAIALLRQTPVGWLVYEYSLGASDVPWIDWPKEDGAPRALFPGP